MALNRVWIPSPNYSSRGSNVRLVVVHTTQGGGSDTFRSLGNYFANPNAQVSSHTGIDDTPGEIGEYVRRENKAWTAANANPYSVQAECCAMAEWSPAEWAKHPTMLSNCAQWIAEECGRYGIPVRKLSESEAAAGQAGVCGHADLGFAGNDHWDPGPSFPWADVIRMAQGGTPPQPEPPKPKPPEEEMALIAPTFYFNGQNHIFSLSKVFGNVWHKWSHDGIKWNDECLLGPGGTGKVVNTGKKIVEITAPSQTTIDATNMAVVTMVDEDSMVWICRQNKGETTWDRRKMPA
jgi:hypothetical protein